MTEQIQIATWKGEPSKNHIKLNKKISKIWKWIPSYKVKRISKPNWGMKKKISSKYEPRSQSILTKISEKQCIPART